MFSDPERNVEQFGLQSGSRVADLGAGSGFYTLALARAVGGKGQVYAVDVQKELLTKVKHAAAEKRLHNIHVLWGDLEKPTGSGLEDASVDAAVAANILFQIGDKRAFAAEAKRILKDGGRLLVVDWRDSFRGMGPEAKLVVSAEAAEALFGGAGFARERSISAGEHHWGIIFRKPIGTDTP